MNKRRGFRRLGVAIAVPYFGFWSLVAAINYLRFNDPYGSVRQRDSAAENLGAALFYGLIVPLIVLICLAVAYWVYRGFADRGE